MQLGTVDSFTIETFRGDLDALHAMAIGSWRDEYRGKSFPDLYAPDLIRLLCGPSLSSEHLLGVYDGDECVAFLANLPRTMRLRGRPVRAILTGLLAVHRAYFRRGVAEALCRAAIALNARVGYDLSIFYVDAGHRSKALFAKLRADGLPYHPLRRVRIYGRGFDVETVRDSESLSPLQARLLRWVRFDRPPSTAPLAGVRPYRPADLHECVALLNAHAARVDLARVFTAEELARLLEHPGRAETLVVEREGHVVALLNWLVYEHISHAPQRFAWPAHVSFGTLTARDRRALLAAFLCRVRDAGCIGSLAFGMGYVPMAPFLWNGFLPFPRSLTLYGCFFPGAGPVRRLRRFFDMVL